MNQKIYSFGKQNNLVGILQAVSDEGDKKTSLLILILNSGLVNMSGPFRVNAELAMYLHQLGYTTFRFDLAGIGDSILATNDARAYTTRHLDDIGEALGLLNRLYPERGVIVLGLCTGADLAHRAAYRYQVIKGAIILDGYGYPTARFYWVRYKYLLTSVSGLVSLPRKILKRLTRYLRGKENESGQATDRYIWIAPPKKEYIQQLAELSNRNCKQLYIYTSGAREYYNYENQLADSVAQPDIVDYITVIVNENADHTYIILEERKKLFSMISEWLSIEFSCSDSSKADF